jgi:hypothetical protein
MLLLIAAFCLSYLIHMLAWNGLRTAVLARWRPLESKLASYLVRHAAALVSLLLGTIIFLAIYRLMVPKSALSLVPALLIYSVGLLTMTLFGAATRLRRSR